MGWEHKDKNIRMGWKYKDEMRIQGWDENTRVYKDENTRIRIQRREYKDGMKLQEWDENTRIRIQG